MLVMLGVLALFQDACDGACKSEQDARPGMGACTMCRRPTGSGMHFACDLCVKMNQVCRWCGKGLTKPEHCNGCLDHACDAKSPVCALCEKNATADAHALICDACAKEKRVCNTCFKPNSPPPFDLSTLPGHRPGREIEPPKGLDVRLFALEHSETPCKTCAPQLRALGVIETQEGGPKTIAWIATSEKDAEKLLKRRKIPGSPQEVALCAAQTVQALWIPIHGALKPEAASEVRIEDGKAEFEYKKGHAYWKLVVTLDKDGKFSGLEVEDTGRRCR